MKKDLIAEELIRNEIPDEEVGEEVPDEGDEDIVWLPFTQERLDTLNRVDSKTQNMTEDGTIDAAHVNVYTIDENGDKKRIGVVDAINNVKTHFDEELEVRDDKIKVLMKDVLDLVDKTYALSEDMRSLGNEVYEKYISLKTKIENIYNLDISSIRLELAELRKMIIDTNEHIDVTIMTKLEALSLAIDKIDTDVLYTRLNDLEILSDSHSEKINDLETVVNYLSKDIRDLQNVADNIEEELNRLDYVTQNIFDLGLELKEMIYNIQNTDINSIRSKLYELNQAVENIQNQDLTAIRESISRAEVLIDSLSGDANRRLDELDERTIATHNTVERNTSDIGSLQSSVNYLLSRTNGLESRVNDLTRYINDLTFEGEAGTIHNILPNRHVNDQVVHANVPVGDNLHLIPQLAANQSIQGSFNVLTNGIQFDYNYINSRSVVVANLSCHISIPLNELQAAFAFHMFLEGVVVRPGFADQVMMIASMNSIGNHTGLEIIDGRVQIRLSGQVIIPAHNNGIQIDRINPRMRFQDMFGLTNINFTVEDFEFTIDGRRSVNLTEKLDYLNAKINSTRMVTYLENRPMSLVHGGAWETFTAPALREGDQIYGIEVRRSSTFDMNIEVDSTFIALHDLVGRATPFRFVSRTSSSINTRGANWGVIDVALEANFDSARNEFNIRPRLNGDGDTRTFNVDTNNLARSNSNSSGFDIVWHILTKN